MEGFVTMKTSDFSGGGWGDVEFERDRRDQQKKTALLIFLGVITSLFFLFITALMLRSQYSDWEYLTAPWQPLSDPWPLQINTGFLLLSSIALQWAYLAARRGRLQRSIEAFIVGGLCALAFVAGQILVWRGLVSEGYVMASNPANAFFFILTGLHALHLLGGIIVCLSVSIKAWRGLSVERLTVSLKLCAIYFHYLLALWLVLYNLLTSSPESFSAFAAFCGF
jgi:cytochrome c oxidase subunit 3